MHHGQIEIEENEVANLYCGNVEIVCENCGEINVRELGTSSEDLDSETNEIVCSNCSETIISN